VPDLTGGSPFLFVPVFAVGLFFDEAEVLVIVDAAVGEGL
jgi:hypothetical protein